MAAQLQQWCTTVLRMHPTPPLEVLEVLLSSPQSVDLWEYLVKRVRRPEQVDLVRKNLLVTSKTRRDEYEGKGAKRNSEIQELERDLKELQLKSQVLEGDLKDLRTDLCGRAETARIRERSNFNAKLMSAVRGFHCSRVRSVARIVKKGKEDLESLAKKNLPTVTPDNENAEPRYVIKENGGEIIQTELEASVKDAIDQVVQIAGQAHGRSARFNSIIDKLGKSYTLMKIIRALRKSQAWSNQGIPTDPSEVPCDAFQVRKRLIRKLRKDVLSSYLSLRELTAQMVEQEKAISQRMKSSTDPVPPNKALEAIAVGERAALEYVRKEEHTLQSRIAGASLVAKMEIIKTKDCEINLLDEKLLRHRMLVRKMIAENGLICNALRTAEDEFRLAFTEKLPQHTSYVLEVLTSRVRFEQETHANIARTDPDIDSRIKFQSQRTQLAKFRVLSRSPLYPKIFSTSRAHDSLFESCINACVQALTGQFRVNALRRRLDDGEARIQDLRGRAEQALSKALQAKDSVLNTWRKPLEMELANLKYCLDSDVPSIEEDIEVWWTQPVREVIKAKSRDGKSLVWQEDRFRKLHLRS